MNRTIPVALAVLLVGSLFAMPVIATEPAGDGTPERPDGDLQQPTLHSVSPHDESPMPVEGTTNRLQIHGDIQSGRTTHTADLGLKLATMDDQLRVDREQYTLIDSEFAAASPEERENMVRSAYTRITERMAALEEREREAVRNHADGDISDRELIQTLIRNHNEATVLSEALNQLKQERTDEIPGYRLSNQQTRADEIMLSMHQTSLQSTLATTTQSLSDRQLDILVETSENGYSLSMIEGDTYVVETVRFDHRDADADNQFADLTTSEIAKEATGYYPWAEAEGSASFRDGSMRNLYVTTFEMDDGRLQMYLDGGTGEVYREAQELSLESLPEEETETWSENGLDVSLMQTPAIGPTKVTVVDNETGEPVSATVSIDGTAVGQTDEDGTLWVLPPATSDGYELTVETTSERINTTVEPN